MLTFNLTVYYLLLKKGYYKVDTDINSSVVKYLLKYTTLIGFNLKITFD
jgi:hypothetical protein